MDREILMLQSADPVAYAEMIHVSGVANRAYAARHGMGYSLYLGIRRGYFPWHACFNRILILKEMILAGYKGWVFYLDADAYVYDQAFDIRAYLDSLGEVSMVVRPGGVDGHGWDINDGAFLIDLANPMAIEIIDRWYEDFMATPEAELAAAEEWEAVPSDQPRLQRILRENDYLAKSLRIVDPAFFNDYSSTFLRQAFRGENFTIQQRVDMIKKDLADLDVPDWAW
ncbi:hypothetical protein ACETK8_19410 [Brevundimonas staleyi]|uniref:Nucleotide-diphospho-sugar transferase domain-containing protein n=1 Tax=Brevundimonas staleyi TaxID=74326 RepID=A0ABW0FUM6_9CAUL